jgi:hypothetical protein
MREPLITVVESTAFARQASAIWSQAEYETFVTYIAANPEVGDFVPGTGGVRKLRWRRPGTGKRGGTRVIYYYTTPAWPLYLLKVYAKNAQSDLSADEIQAYRKMTDELKALRAPK